MIVVYLAKAFWRRRADGTQGTRAIRQTPARPWLEIADLPIVVPGIGTTSGARLRWLDPKSSVPMVEVDRG